MSFLEDISHDLVGEAVGQPETGASKRVVVILHSSPGCCDTTPRSEKACALFMRFVWLVGPLHVNRQQQLLR